VSDPNKVIDRFLGDAATPIDWAGEEEKRLHFWFDDLHCPQPISPMYFDAGGWWQTCGYMYRRFGLPFGKDWVGKKVGEYVFSAVVPRDPKEASELGAYCSMVMPVYASKFLHWWKHRYLPEILRNFEFLDTYPMDTASLPELMVLLEDAFDIQERHFRLHWILNLAQFQSALDFQSIVRSVIGAQHDSLVGRILVSDEDRNWDSIRELWKLKERIAPDPTLRAAFRAETVAGVFDALRNSECGRELLKDLEAYKNEYGNKAIYTHEYIFPTWRENPAPIMEALRGYLDSDYDYEKDVRQLRASREAAIAELWSLFPVTGSPENREKVQAALDLALKMTPLTPDHHFYMDQGTYARVRLVLMAIGRGLVADGVFAEPDDVMFLKYEELRGLSANHSLFDAKALIRDRREKRAAAYSSHPPDWVGTITQWSLYEEPYKGHWGWPDVYTKAAERAKQPKGTIQGLGASAGVVEGRARIVHSPEQFDRVRQGEILVCKMTNPAWVLVFTRIAGLVTDAGGTLSHPAVIAREFGIPAVVGTGVATRKIVDGQLIRLNGTEGIVELLD
jgi:phosphohistidine swiveling domain-containing protein